MITIIDYGMGNLGSVKNMFTYIGVESIISSKIDEIEKAKKILLPGVGAFDTAMSCINEMGFRNVLNYKALEEKVPVLGICLGMQLMTDGSDEGELPGLGWISAHSYRFSRDSKVRIPHMGWNEVTISKSNSITEGLENFNGNSENARFYFVHSYHVKVANEENSMLKTNYGVTFDSGIQNGNIVGCQFHPEKSHKFGMHLLRNFANS